MKTNSNAEKNNKTTAIETSNPVISDKIILDEAVTAEEMYHHH